jgi:hypothetical protein
MTALVVSGLILIGALAPFATGLSLLVQVPVALVILTAGAHAVKRLVSPDIESLKIDAARIQIRHRSGARSSGRLIGSPFVSPLYVGLRWRPADSRLPRSVGIFRGQMAGADFRRLCAALRLQEGQ